MTRTDKNVTKSYYGMLKVKTTNREVMQIWRSRDDDLDELPCIEFDEEVDYFPAIEAKNLLEKIFSKMRINKKEEYVLIHRMLGNATLKEVAKELDVSTEEVRRIQKQLRYKIMFAVHLIDKEVAANTIALGLKVVS